jgi:ABC-type glutathione transport system ATPase component
MVRFAFAVWPVDMTTTYIPVLAEGRVPEQSYFVAVWTFWVFLAIQIIAYPLLAILAERLLHGVNSKGRILSETTGDEANVAFRVSGLTKVYKASWLRKIFLCGKGRKNLKALDGLDMVAYKNQILCLLGANGAGKSTTLELLAGAHTPTAGTMAINARAAKIGTYYSSSEYSSYTYRLQSWFAQELTHPQGYALKKTCSSIGSPS